MRAATFLRRLPWLALVLVGCGDEVAGAPGSGSGDGSGSADSTTTAATSNAESSTLGGHSTTGDLEATGDTSGNAAPKAVDDVVFARQDSALVLDSANGLLGNDGDPDGDPFAVAAFEAVSARGGDVVIGEDGAVQYEPAAGFWGTDMFEYTIEDDTGGVATATVTVHVAPVWIPLAEVTAGMGGFVLDGEEGNDRSGESVSGAGDVNGDGLDDVIVGVFRVDANGFESGRSYVVFGKADTAAVELSAITAGIGGFVLDGEFHQDRSGVSVSGAGDVNGDGMDDIIVGAEQADPNGQRSGRSYVVFGKADTAAVDPGAITQGVGGFVLNGEAAYDRSGESVSGAGDVNGDGLDDLIVGASWADVNGNRSGRSYVVFGKADTAAVELSAITAGIGGFALDGEAAVDYAGGSVSGAGDVNGDGMDDIIVGAYGAAPNGNRSGRSYVVFGKTDTAAVELSAIAAGLGGFVLDGEVTEDRSGRSVSGAGDVNGDGVSDVIVGADQVGLSGALSGRSYVVFGKVDTSLVELSTITAGIGGFALEGEFRSRSGYSVSGAGDINGDGTDDIIIGATQAGASSGRSYVVFGVPMGAN